MKFEPFPKIPRLNRETIVTEKIDGTNACVVIEPSWPGCPAAALDSSGDFLISAQSRKRLICPGDDNFGFATWVRAHQDRLVEILGPGRHFGEWWGQGIGRRYGLTEKRFSLFNTSRWQPAREASGEPDDWAMDAELGLYVVPTLATYPHIPRSDWELRRLQEHGSFAAPGFMKPEGIIVYHSASNSMFKATCENDEVPKALATGGIITKPQLTIVGESDRLCTVPGMTSLVAA